jgi:acetyltransferase
MIAAARAEGRSLLTEYESKQLLAAYGIPVVDTRVATTEAEAVELADRIGYPVVLKLFSETITHKTDVGGVRLNIPDAETVRKAFRAIRESIDRWEQKQPNTDQNPTLPAFLGVTVQPMLKLEGYELIVGSSLDAQFGPVLLFGTGGQLVEVFQDHALSLPPLNTTLARRMMEQTCIYQALKGVRGRAPIDLTALEQVLVRFSHLVVEQRWIKEVEMNPLLASPERLIALDARVVLHEPETTEAQLPRLAIRPYPLQYVKLWTMKNGRQVIIRPIQPEDEPLMVKFHQNLSEESVYFRYAHMVKLSQRVAHERLTRICFIDYDRVMALVAEATDPQTDEPEILAAGRLTKLHGTQEAEFSMLVHDRHQGQGLATEILRRLIQVGRDEHLQAITADILPVNHAMQHVCQKLGFTLHRTVDEDMEPMTKAVLVID